jgi:hypothetical protein
MADGVQTATAAPNSPDTTPLSYPDFAAKIRARDSRLTPELVDDTTLVNKVLERIPQLKQYVAGEPPKRPDIPEGLKQKRVRVGSGLSPDEQKASTEIDSILKDRETKDLSIPERYQILSILSKEYARQHAEKGKASKGWLEKAKEYMLTLGGADIDVSTRLAGAVSDPKNIAIGATGFVSPAIPAGYFLWEGATRLPGESRKVIADPSYENIVSAGLTGAQVLGGATGMSATESVRTGLPSSEKAGAGTVTSLLQKMTGTGPKLAKEVASSELAAREKTAAATAKLQDDLKIKVKRINEDYNAKIDTAKRTHADSIAAREKAIAEAEADYVQQIAKVTEEHKRELAKASHERRGQAMIEAHRQKLDSQEKGLAEAVQHNVKNTGDLVTKEFDRRWDDARNIAGNDTPMDSVATKSIIEEAREGLHGVPADVTLFNQIMNEIEGGKGKDQVDIGAAEESSEEGRPVKAQTWGAMRDQFSALGTKMYSGDLPGNVYNALKLVRDGFRPGENAEKAGAVQDPRSFDAQLTKVMDAKGAKDLYKKLKSDYSQYMHDWHDTRNIPGGNGPRSPLAKLYRSIDPSTTIRQSTGPFTDRLIQQFGKYDKSGAAPSIINTLRDNNFELNKLPKPKHVPEPETPAVHTPAVVAAGEKLGKLKTEPVKGTDTASRLGQTRDIRIARAIEDTKRKIDRLAKSHTPEEVLALLKELKQAKIESNVEAQYGLRARDTIYAVLATEEFMRAVAGQANLLKFAPLYIAYRLGEIAAYRNPKFQDALSRITDADMAQLNKIYDKASPEEKAEAQKVFAGGLEARAKQGLPAPPLSRFSKFLTEDQLRKVMRAYVPYGQKREPPKKELGIVPPTESPMQVTAQ